MSEVLSFAHGGPVAKAEIKSCPEDFRVTEDLGFSPTGEGQHQMVRIEKREMNSDQVATKIAKFMGLKRRDVGVAGLKDRAAITQQWFSVDLMGKAPPDWSELECETEYGGYLKVVKAELHNRKIRTGALRGNWFKLILRNIEYSSDLNGSVEKLEQRLEQIKREGVPNYFGEQRFGRGGSNVAKALQIFDKKYKPRGRHERGLLLSSVRSEIFNHILSHRVASETWNRALVGEVYSLDKSKAYFHQEEIDSEVERRLREHDIHPSAPLWGDGELESSAAARELEESVVQGIERFADMQHGLAGARMEHGRRSLRLIPEDMSWRMLDGVDSASNLELSFWLPAGAYATVVLRELIA